MRTEHKKRSSHQDLKAAGVSQNTVVRRVRGPRGREKAANAGGKAK